MELEIEKPAPSDLVGKFITAWSDLYGALESIANHQFPGRNLRGATSIIPEIAARGYLTQQNVDEIKSLTALRNDVVHGKRSELQQKMIDRLNLESQAQHSAPTETSGERA